MPVLTEAPASKKTKYKMKLVNNEYLEEHGGWCPAGSVLVVDEDTAERWFERHIATPAGRDEKTVREIRREENLKKLQAAAVAADEDDDGPTPFKQPTRPTTRRARTGAKPDLTGANVINSFDSAPDDDAYGADGDEE